MDVEFLSGMISELMLDHDSLSLPGIGTFVAEDMPASFSDRGYTINPPYRRLSFSGRQTSDSLLTDLYTGANPSAPKEAEAVLLAFLQELKDDLVEQKSIELPGLGRLRATRENHFFFVADEALDISPEACGLESVSLKTHSAPALSGIADLVGNDVTGTGIAESCPAELIFPDPGIKTASNETEAAENPANRIKTAANETETAATPAPRRRIPAPARWAIGIAAAAILALAGFVALSRIAPDITDKWLYTPEELEIINYQEDGLGLPG